MIVQLHKVCSCTIIHSVLTVHSSSGAPCTTPAVYTILCSCCAAGLCTGAAGVVHRCIRLRRLCTRGCVHHAHNLCAHTTSAHTQPWITVHTVLPVHAVLYAAAVGIWTVHSQDCSQPLTLTSRCTHLSAQCCTAVHTLCIDPDECM